MDGTNSFLNRTVSYCDGPNSTNTTEDSSLEIEILTAKENSRNQNYKQRHEIYLKYSNTTIEESLRLTKCCTEKYFEFLENKLNNSTYVDKVLDVFLGTVELIVFLILNSHI